MRPFTEPSLAGFHPVKVLSVDTADAAPLVFLLLHDDLLHDEARFLGGHVRLRMKAPLLRADILDSRRRQLEADSRTAFERIHGDLSVVVVSYDAVDDVEPVLDRDILDGSGGEYRQLVLPEVIDEVPVDGRGLDRESLRLFVDDDPVR